MTDSHSCAKMAVMNWKEGDDDDETSRECNDAVKFVMR